MKIRILATVTREAAFAAGPGGMHRLPQPRAALEEMLRDPRLLELFNERNIHQGDFPPDAICFYISAEPYWYAVNK